VSLCQDDDETSINAYKLIVLKNQDPGGHRQADGNQDYTQTPMLDALWAVGGHHPPSMLTELWVSTLRVITDTYMSLTFTWNSALDSSTATSRLDVVAGRLVHVVAD
jgi:hypothetical protein